jgi:hypothetical protein
LCRIASLFVFLDRVLLPTVLMFLFADNVLFKNGFGEVAIKLFEGCSGGSDDEKERLFEGKFCELPRNWVLFKNGFGEVAIKLFADDVVPNDWDGVLENASTLKGFCE